MKDKAHDLNNILFEAAERLRDLDDEDIKSGKLASELQRARGIKALSVQIISNGRLVLDAIQLQLKAKGAINEMPDMLKAEGLKLLPEPGKKKLA
jgi:hypothetical protein